MKSAGLDDIIDVITNSKLPRFNALQNNQNQSKYCFACGNKKGFAFANIINDDLADKWSLSKGLRKGFDIRESSKCVNCGSSLRSSLHARAICKILAPKTKNLTEAMSIKSFNRLRIAEINSCGSLHKIIKDHPRLKYSEYAPSDKSIKRESLDKLSYATNYFDLVITSETLEHVPDWMGAMNEIKRILKPNGLHIFTVPAILTRQTRCRAYKEKDKIINLLPEAYHGYNRENASDYLVFNEFGADMRKSIDKLGFSTKVYFINYLHISDPNFVFVSTKV